MTMNDELNKTKVTVIDDGPLMIEGNFQVKGVDGKLMETNNQLFLCRCGKSTNKPYCDGSHHK